jgi:hypothetical protein
MTSTRMDPESRPATPTGSARSARPSGVWVAAATLGIVAALLLRVRTRPDIDLWLHLRIGDMLRAGERFGTPPDPLAELADRAYVPTQWLSQVGMSIVYDVWGMNGIQITRVLLVLLLGVLVVAAARVTAPATAAAIAAAITMFSTSIAWGERPQLAATVLLGAAVLLWWRALDQGRVPWLVMPLAWVWALVHGSWILGVAVGVLLTVGGLLDGRWSGRTAYLVAGVPAFSLVAAALTPLGPRGALEPFRMGEAARTFVNEWQTPSLLNPLVVVVLASALVGLLGILRSSHLRWTRLLTVVASVALALWMVRTIAVGAVVLTPALAAGLATVGGRSRDRDSTLPFRSEARAWGLGAVLFLVIAGWHALTTPFPAPVSSTVSAAVDDIPTDTHVAVDGRAVGWLQWAHRDLRPLRDLRAEVYSLPVALAYDDFKEARPGWQDYVDEHGITVVLADRSEPLDAALAGEPRWHVAAEDADFRLWVTE